MHVLLQMTNKVTGIVKIYWNIHLDGSQYPLCKITSVSLQNHIFSKLINLNIYSSTSLMSRILKILSWRINKYTRDECVNSLQYTDIHLSLGRNITNILPKLVITKTGNATKHNSKQDKQQRIGSSEIIVVKTKEKQQSMIKRMKTGRVMWTKVNDSTAATHSQDDGNYKAWRFTSSIYTDLTQYHNTKQIILIYEFTKANTEIDCNCVISAWLAEYCNGWKQVGALPIA